MSTIAYAQLTNTREASPSGKSTTTDNPGIKTYIDAFAALVPAEVLTLHSGIISVTTETAKKAVANGGEMEVVTTTILPNAAKVLQVSFWGLVLMSIALYVIPKCFFGGKWDKLDWIRVTIAPLAFFGWTMLQRTTAFDAAFPDIPAIPRLVAALFLGAILVFVTVGMAIKADTKPPATQPAHEIRPG